MSSALCHLLNRWGLLILIPLCLEKTSRPAPSSNENVLWPLSSTVPIGCSWLLSSWNAAQMRRNWCLGGVEVFRYFRSLGHLNLAPGYAVGQSHLECGPSHAIRINHLRGFGHSSLGQQGQQMQPLPICPAHTLLTRALSHFFRKGPYEINSIPHIYTAHIWESTVFTCL